MNIRAAGFEFANFQAGLDFNPTRHFYLGPFLSISLNQFSSLDADCSGVGCETQTVEDGAIVEKSLHEWIVFGIRGGYSGYGH